MKIAKAQNLLCVLAFVAGASLAVVACKDKDDDEKKEESTDAAATGVKALVLQLNASCSGQPCL